MELQHLTLERPVHGVAVVSLDDPERRNAMTQEMTTSWVRAMEHLAGDREVRVVVVTGKGSAFCSGGDTDWLMSEPEASVAHLRARMLGFYRSWLAVRRLEVPTIAAINGPAIGAGLCLALACDIRFAARGSRMGMSFVRIGLHPGMGGTRLLPEVAGHGAARDLMLSGRLVGADDALALGLVTRVWNDDEFQQAVMEAATDIAANAPVATRLTKASMVAAGDLALEDTLRSEALAQAVTLASADFREGVAASRERRSAAFHGL